MSVDGPIDAVYVKPGDYVELDVGTGETCSNAPLFIVKTSRVDDSMTSAG